MMELFGAALLVVSFLIAWESEKMIQEKKERR
jgi:hypothetical protein